MQLQKIIIIFLFILILVLVGFYTYTNDTPNNEFYCEFDSDCVLIQDCCCGTAVNKEYAQFYTKENSCENSSCEICAESYTLSCMENVCVKIPNYSEPIQIETITINFEENPNQSVVQAPSDKISEEQISVFENYVTIRQKNIFWSRYTNTNSMIPTFDEGANGLELIPRDINDIQVGDIISFRPEEFAPPIIHRVIEINFDEEGWYAITKGDNNKSPDPWRVRFSQVEGVLFAIIY